jgi:hypothetical protein
MYLSHKTSLNQRRHEKEKIRLRIGLMPEQSANQRGFKSLQELRPPWREFMNRVFCDGNLQPETTTEVRDYEPAGATFIRGCSRGTISNIVDKVVHKRLTLLRGDEISSLDRQHCQLEKPCCEIVPAPGESVRS